ncbi:MAG TPA: HEAT repeat domain-containing protein [Methanoregulaceae archaeon]|nr:HEAT repeat domain-containing protein [Methanoregulaceae archaeon]
MAFDDLKIGGLYGFKPIILGILLAFSLFLEIVLHVALHISVIYTHFFYIPVVLGAIWYGKKGVVVALFLALVLLVGTLQVTGTLESGALIRATMFIVVALVIGVVSDLMRSEQKKMINEVADAAISSGLFTAGIKENLEDLKIRVLSYANVQKLKDEKNVKGLIIAFKRRDPGVQYEAVEALGELGDPVAVDVLMEALVGDKYSGIRWKAAEALTKIGKPAVPRLIGALDNPDDDVRWKAAIALGEIGDPRAVEPLIALLGDEDRFVKSRAAYALGIMGEPAISALISALEEKDPSLRWGAAMALGSIRGPAAIRPLIRATTDADENVRQEAMSSLTAMGDKGLETLLEALKWAGPEEKINIITVLGEIGRKESIEPLIQLLETSDGETRAHIGRTVILLGGPDLKNIYKNTSNHTHPA